MNHHDVWSIVWALIAWVAASFLLSPLVGRYLRGCEVVEREEER